MADPLQLLSQRFADAFAALAGSPVDPVVRPSEHADAQVNGALSVAKSLGRAPRDVANDVLGRVGDVSDMCETVDVAGPGFMNVVFAAGFLADQLRAALADTRLGVQAAPTAETVVIDYSAPNVAKEMHVGHLRSTVIGDALVRMHEFVGNRVVRENHIGDWGTPFGMLIEHLLDLGEARAAEEFSVGDLDGFYKEARKKFEANDEFKERSRLRVVALQAGDEETLRMWRVLVAESTKYFNRVYRQLDVLLTDGDLMGESAYNDLLPKVVERLRSGGHLQQSDGADVMFLDGFTNRDNEPLPLIIRKGDGGYNYATTDLACVIDRVERLGANRMWYVVGAPQAQHLQMVEAATRAAGWLPPTVEMRHVAFGNVLGPDRKMLKSRSGDSVKLSALLDEAVERATAAVREKNPDLDVAAQDAIARMVGIGAVKYADLSTDRVKDYIFDWDRMLSFDGNTAPYLQYAHARICSIFRRAGVARASIDASHLAISATEERALALTVLQFDSAVRDTIDKASPHRLCTYLYEVATAFTAFYENCPVLKSDEPVRSSRLVLCDATARVLQTGLGLLGIDAPEAM
ncbi:MAG: arginine--tRNA ligase [Acidobacteria bacterium]|nr:arginine--tRNA ligase [Acidobacteriota bacterium]